MNYKQSIAVFSEHHWIAQEKVSILLQCFPLVMMTATHAMSHNLFSSCIASWQGRLTHLVIYVPLRELASNAVRKEMCQHIQYKHLSRLTWRCATFSKMWPYSVFFLWVCRNNKAGKWNFWTNIERQASWKSIILNKAHSRAREKRHNPAFCRLLVFLSLAFL